MTNFEDWCVLCGGDLTNPIEWDTRVCVACNEVWGTNNRIERGDDDE